MKKFLLLNIGFLFVLTGCFDLDKYPEGELSSIKAFSTIPEIEKYLNQFYEQGSAVKMQSNIVGTANGIALGDLNSDNMYSNTPDIRLLGDYSLSDATKMSEYD